MNTVAKTLSYKLACLPGGKPVDVQALLSKAIGLSPKAANRMFLYGLNDEGRMFINQHSESEGMLFGAFCAFEPGRHQPVIDTDPDLEVLPIEAIAPPPKAGKTAAAARREFLESILFFGMRGAHVILAQSLALRSPAFETYLNWLLVKKTKVAPEADSFELNDQMKPEMLTRVNKTRGISMTRPVEFTISKQRSVESEVHLKPRGSVWDAVKGFLGDANPILPQGVRLKDVVKAGQIQATLELKWKNKRDDDETPLLDQIANVLRHTDDVDYSIDMGKYGKLTREELKLTKAYQIDVVNGRINEQNVYRRMREWLADLLKSERVLSKPC